MKVAVYGIGKTNESYLEEGIAIYLKRLKHYTNIEMLWLADVKKFSDQADLMAKESEHFQQQISNDDFLIVCDERGKSLTSKGMSMMLETRQVAGTKRVVFLIGGAFGVSDVLKKRADLLLSLSDMTFSHQMIRLFLMEQIYRAFTILRNEKYHNE